MAMCMITQVEGKMLLTYNEYIDELIPPSTTSEEVFSLINHKSF